MSDFQLGWFIGFTPWLGVGGLLVARILRNHLDWIMDGRPPVWLNSLLMKDVIP